MQTNWIIAILLIIFFVFLLMTKTQKRKPRLKALSELTDIKRRSPLTKFEQRMFFAVKEALPEYILLAQVSFSSLITTDSKQTRNRFDRKTADFVLCNLRLEPLAIIELDDPSHIGKEIQDAERDAMLANAGYTTIRYKKIPPRDELRSDIAALQREKGIFKT